MVDPHQLLDGQVEDGGVLGRGQVLHGGGLHVALHVLHAGHPVLGLAQLLAELQEVGGQVGVVQDAALRLAQEGLNLVPVPKDTVVAICQRTVTA